MPFACNLCISLLEVDVLTMCSTENGIDGEALIALKHEELKELGVNSVGHRLTLLKSVYETKIKQDIPFDSDHYVPLCKCYRNSCPLSLGV